MPYSLAPPQGWEAVLIFEKKQLANSNWQLAKANPKTVYHEGHEATQRKTAEVHAKLMGISEVHANLG